MEKRNDANLHLHNIYTSAGFYMLRAPALSAEIFERISSTSQTLSAEIKPDIRFAQIRQQCYSILKQLVLHPSVAQALTIASSDIFEGLTRIQHDDVSSPKRLERAYSGLLRYLVRMSTRPTPFGLFAGVALGILSNSTSVQLACPVLQRMRIRPDMGWLLAFVQQIEGNKDFMRHLHVMINSTIYIAGNRIIVPDAEVYGEGNNRCITLRATPVVRYILKKARTPVSYQELRTCLVQTFPNAEEDLIDNLLQQLWDHHVLISDLRPPLTLANPSKYVMNYLLQIPETRFLGEGLREILQESTEVDNEGIGGSPTLIRSLIQHQKELVPSYKYECCQVDAALHLNASSFNRTVGDALAQAAETLLLFSPYPHGLHHLHEYRQAFLERYGSNVEVPILDLLSPELGLDAPPKYTEPPRDYPLQALPPSETKERDSILCDLLFDALNRHSLEVEVRPEHLERLRQAVTINPPSTLEVYCQLCAFSPQAIDHGEWRAIINFNALAYGGRTFSRFFDILDIEDVKHLETYTKQEENLFPDVIFAELSYLPKWGRAANVTIHPPFREYEIVLNTSSSVPDEHMLSLDDLVVGVRKNRFYVRSLRFGKEIIVNQSHMLNLAKAPNVCRFLLEIAHDSQPVLSYFHWGPFKEAPFLPRVVQNKVVLMPACWNVKQSMIVPTGTGSDEVRWFAGLQQWRVLYHVPQYVYLVEGDNRLLLDLEHPVLAKELYNELKKRDAHYLTLQEMLPDFDHLWLRDTTNAPYIGELVIPLIIRNNAKATTGLKRTLSSQPHPNYPQCVISRQERCQLPGGDWTSLKIYASFKQQNEIITTSLHRLIQKLHEQGLIDHWFFIRYADPEPHLRIRLHTASPYSNNDVLINSLDWSRQLFNSDLISRAIVDSYEREIERYGGPEAIETIERVFSADSDVVSELVTILSSKKTALDPLIIGVFSLDLFFCVWGLDLASRIEYIQSRPQNFQKSKELRQWRKLLSELLFPCGSAYSATMEVQRRLIQTCCAVWDPVLKEASQHLRSLAAEKNFGSQNILF